MCAKKKDENRIQSAFCSLQVKGIFGIREGMLIVRYIVIN